MAQEDLSASFHSSTETLSNQVRYVNYSLIAVVWLLGGNAVSGLKTDNNGLILFFIVLSLFLDMCQYIWISVTTWFHMKKKGKRLIAKRYKPNTKGTVTVAKELSPAQSVPAYIPNGTWYFYIAKLVACLIACIIVGIRLTNWLMN
jgi:hypothetical protein